MYNTINPINIVYRKPQPAVKKQEEAKNALQEKTPDVLDKREQQQFPHGAPVAIDYTKNKINISQVLTDFKSTIVAINAPQDVSEEVGVYLELVEKESQKEKPSREIIVSNLKNASKISDRYITGALGKPSKVVEEWVDALFLQNIVLKADPTQINEDFRVQIPENKKADEVNIGQNIESQGVNETLETEQIAPVQVQQVQEEKIASEVPQTIEEDTSKAPQTSAIRQITSAEEEFLAIFKNAKKLSKNNSPKEALIAFQSALDKAPDGENSGLRGAVHLERGKIFDRYDHIGYALSEYNKATKCEDDNIKTHAHLKMAKIYDDYTKFEPALEHYHCAISSSVNNPAGQSVALKGIGKMYSERYDVKNAQTFNDLALDSAKESENLKLIGKTYKEVAKDWEYLGENRRALQMLRESTETFIKAKQDNLQIAQNYYDASRLMRSLGNEAKADSLLSKAHQYQLLE